MNLNARHPHYPATLQTDIHYQLSYSLIDLFCVNDNLPPDFSQPGLVCTLANGENAGACVSHASIHANENQNLFNVYKKRVYRETRLCLVMCIMWACEDL